ncbi:GNAT family N-acetyltransferase [Vibrio vulnificus]|uniref:GNAT family N-acetyltransferase n=1 Tax=Vibrio vulnificus TaxID=672 RepID=UPI0015B5730F|nr:GNAT family N-acetyltransferase [Vibrio vulnificus]EHT4943455.1 GNAT family N-acetyltransferase [Vibrio vulnificus]
MDKYKELYKKFLGVEVGAKSQVFLSENRSTPINNKYLHEIILSKISGNFYCSTNFIRLNECNAMYTDSLKVVDVFKSYYTDLKARNFERYIIRDANGVSREISPLSAFDIDALNVNEIHKKRFIEKYSSALHFGLYFGLIKDNKIVSHAYVSDITNGLANIVVYTDFEYRGKGYASLLLSNCVVACYREGIIPMYLVESKNKISKGLLKSFCVELLAEEIIFSREVDCYHTRNLVHQQFSS